MEPSQPNFNNLWNDANYIPHFQPIVDAANRKILGYEVLGRLYLPSEKQITSLGPYFHNKSFNLSQKAQVDRIIREKAILYLKTSGVKTKLFFNFIPNVLSSIHQDELLDPNRFHLIQLIEKYEIDRENIVIEITEDEFSGKIERLLAMVEIFRNYGFKIAIDDMGAGFSNLERIGYIHPDIIKVDIRIMKESLNRNSFRQVLSAISEMSLKLGSELLFEGIENEKELTLALSMGANLLQGFYFSKATSEFQNKSYFSDDLSIILEKFSGIRFLELIENCQRQESIIKILRQAFSECYSFQAKLPTLLPKIPQILSQLPEDVFELFVADLHGYQVSPTYTRHRSKGWQESSRDTGNNYAWKPYFMKHKANTYYFDKNWNVTDPLYDISLELQYVIFTFNLTKNLIFITKVKW
ncbi:MAG: EAL domain-containing protein [Spirochaetota bacterium]